MLGLLKYELGKTQPQLFKYADNIIGIENRIIPILKDEVTLQHAMIGYDVTAGPCGPDDS